MRKILPCLIAVLMFSAISGQGQQGTTVTGIKGIKKDIASIIAYEKAHPVSANFKPKLGPELEGPKPKGQDPAAKKVSKFGTLVDAGTTTQSSVTQMSTQAVTSNFLTIWGNYGTAIPGRESPYTPPDNCGDVGTTQIVATANCRMKVFNKPSVTGTPVTSPTGTSTTEPSVVADIELNAFFSNSALGISGISDPHVRFDRLTKRWFVIAIDINHKTNNYCAVAVSSSETITSASSFTIYYFNVSGTGGSSTDFFDYPTLGIDKNSLYIGGNMFRNQQTFSGSNMWVVNKASVIAGSMTVTGFPQTATGTDMYTPQGVHNDDPGATAGYFIGASQTMYSKLVIRRITYSGSTPSISGDLNVTTATIYSPKTVPTLGGTSIDGNDRRLCAAMIRKNKITGATNMWIAQGTLINSSGVGGSGGDRDGALWAEIGNLATTPSILQGGMVYDGVNPTSSAVYYTYPTIALSGQGHSLMGFTSAGPAKYAQASATGRYRTDPAGTFQAPQDFTNTTSTYNPGASRWGDYTQTVVDPNDDMTMWTFSEYVPTTNAWGVRAAQFKAPPPATPALSAVPACGATTNITINGTSVNNSEFFDPGTDAGGPGFNRLNISVSGPSPVTVTNMVLVNPLQITASFSVPSNATAGTYTVTVKNPDGQTATTSFNLSCGTVSCGDPTGLASSNITTTSATVSWAAVTNATSYSVQYKANSSSTWITAASATTATSVNLSNLTAGTLYDWQVNATCSTATGNYVAAQFTTASAIVCNAPAGLSSSKITSNSATVSWGAVSGASSYDVDYSLAGANSWTAAATATNSTSVAISNLVPSTQYDWRVRTNCSSGSSSYSTAQFSTTAAANCDVYEPNNTIATATSIVTGTNINGAINPSGDNDYYTFATSGTGKNIKVTLSNQAINCNLQLLTTGGTVLASSANGSTANESMVYNSNKSGTYVVRVYAYNNTDFNASCYTLNVQTGSAKFTALVTGMSKDISLVSGGLKLYPVPASTTINVSFEAYAAGQSVIAVINEFGQKVLTSTLDVSNGTNFTVLNVSSLAPGIYTLQVNNGKEILTRKMSIVR